MLLRLLQSKNYVDGARQVTGKTGGSKGLMERYAILYSKTFGGKEVILVGSPRELDWFSGTTLPTQRNPFLFTLNVTKFNKVGAPISFVLANLCWFKC